MVPKDMHKAKIVTLYKNKSDRNDHSSYRSIPLLSIVGKISSWPDYRFWQFASTQSDSVGSGPRDPSSTWFSPYDNCRRNVVNRTSLYTLPSKI